MKDREGIFSGPAVVALGAPAAGAVLAWGLLRSLRHLEDIWQFFVLLTVSLLVSVVAFCVALGNARGRRVQLACAYLAALLLGAALLFVLFNFAGRA